MDRGTSSSTNPSINTCTNKAFKKNNSEVILNKVEKAVKQLAAEGGSTQLDDIETVGLIAAAMRLTQKEVRDAIDKLKEQKRLPLPLADNPMNSEAVGGTP
jgi:DNA replicative helicase MCM subunit Mcm2 (Cdc46/Mcm family)